MPTTPNLRRASEAREEPKAKLLLQHNEDHFFKVPTSRPVDDVGPPELAG